MTALCSCSGASQSRDYEQIQYRESGQNNWNRVDNVKPPYVLSGLSNDTVYELRVGAVIGKDVHWSNPVTSTPRARPQDLSLQPGAESLTATWSEIGSAVSHQIEYREASDSTWNEITNVTSPHLIPNLTASEQYEVRVAAVYTEITQWSEIETVTLGDLNAPIGVQLTSLDGGLEVTWNAVNNADMYFLDYGLPGKRGKMMRNVTSPTTLSNLTNGQQYQVRVAAIIGYDSYWSSYVLGTAGLHSPPTQVQVQPGDGVLTLSWNEASGAASYKARYRNVVKSAPAPYPAWSTPGGQQQSKSD